MNDWNELEGLYFLFSGLPAHGSVTTDGGDVVTAASSSQGLAPTPATITGPDPTLFDPDTIKIHELPAFQDNGSGGEQGFRFSFSSAIAPLMLPGEGFTIVCIEQRATTGSGAHSYKCDGYGGSTGRGEMGVSRNSGFYRCSTFNQGDDSDIPITTDPAVHIFTSNGQNILETALYHGTVVDAGAPGALVKSVWDGGDGSENGYVQQIDILGGKDGTGAPNGKGALYAIYSRVVNDTEAQQLYDVAVSYLATGAGIDPGTPPTVGDISPASGSASTGGSITFTCTVTGDGPPVETWLVNIGSGEWIEASAAYPGNTVIATGSLTINNLAVQDTQVKLRATNAAAPNGVESGVATLSVSERYDSFTSFGPVRANDPEATYQWLIKPPGEEDWTSTLPEGMAPRVDGEDQYLDVNSATVDQSGTQVKLTADTDYSDGIESNVQTLNVVPAS